MYTAADAGRNLEQRQEVGPLMVLEVSIQLMIEVRGVSGCVRITDAGDVSQRVVLKRFACLS